MREIYESDYNHYGRIFPLIISSSSCTVGASLQSLDKSIIPTSLINCYEYDTRSSPSLDSTFVSDSYETVFTEATLQLYAAVTSRYESLKLRGFFFEKTFGMLSSSPRNSITALKLLLIVLSGDVEIQPGPSFSASTTPALDYPCSMCGHEVGDDDWALECDKCNLWSHINCTGVSEEEYRYFQNLSSFVWYCPTCDIMNISDSLFHLTTDFNPFSPLSDCDTSSAESTRHGKASKLPCSMPINNKGHGRRYVKRSKPRLNNIQKNTADYDMRLLSLNARSLRGKIPEFHAIIDEHKPDIVCVTETHLDATIATYEIFPSDYNVYRKDRNLCGGGVAIAVKNNFASLPCINLDSDSEIIWTQILLKTGKTFLVGCYYRRPDSRVSEWKDLEASLDSIPQEYHTNLKYNKH